jgi:hypothetical protein
MVHGRGRRRYEDSNTNRIQALERARTRLVAVIQITWVDLGKRASTDELRD